MAAGSEIVFLAAGGHRLRRLWIAGKKRQVIFLATICVGWLLYSLIIGGDIFPSYRHFVPAMALMGFMVAGCGLLTLVRLSAFRTARVIFLLLTLLVLTSDLLSPLETLGTPRQRGGHLLAYSVWRQASAAGLGCGGRLAVLRAHGSYRSTGSERLLHRAASFGRPRTGLGRARARRRKVRAGPQAGYSGSNQQSKRSSAYCGQATAGRPAISRLITSSFISMAGRPIPSMRVSISGASTAGWASRAPGIRKLCPRIWRRLRMQTRCV